MGPSIGPPPSLGRLPLQRYAPTLARARRFGPSSIVVFTNGQVHSFGGKYLELVPNVKLRYADAFDDPNRPGEMTTTIVLSAVSCGTEVNIEQSGIPSTIPVEMCHLGWQDSLTLLARLVEAEAAN